MPDVDSLLCKEIGRTRGVNPLLLIEAVGRFGPDNKEALRQYLLNDKHQSESVAEKMQQAVGAYWKGVDRAKRRKQTLF